MKTALAAVAGFVLLLNSVNVCSELVFISGNQLKQQLDTHQDSFVHGAATGFILGVHDTTSGTIVCAPQQVNVQQVTNMVRKYLTEHPEKLHIKASDLVINALSAAFPCRK